MINICIYCNKQFKTNRSSRKFCCREHANKYQSIKKIEHRDLMEVKKVWACGAGIDSTAIALMICSEMIEKPDYAIMCDCGYEMESTWDYVYSVLMPKLNECGVELTIIKSSKYTDTNIINAKGYCRIPAHSITSTGNKIKYRTHCSSGWKKEVARKWLKKNNIKKIENWVGIAADESHRAKTSDAAWITNRYPLIEHGWTRERCCYEIGKAQWPMPRRSSCIMCPLKTDKDWIDMKLNHKNDFIKACEIDESLRLNNINAYIHRSCKPLIECI